MGTAGENSRILLLDLNPESQGRVASILSRAGYEVIRTDNRVEARGLLGRRHHDAAILDLEPGSPGGSRLVRSLREVAPNTPLLVLTDSSHIQEAVKVLRHGADDYLLRPPDPFELKTRLGRILERHELDSRVALLQDELSKKRHGPKKLVGNSTAMSEALDRVMRVAPMQATVLIFGESGVGKELIARSIHFNSLRRDQAFIALNCAAIPPNLIESELFGHERGSFTGAHTRARGKFELANRGTIFLDEIGAMSPSAQVKLLRILEEREFMRVGGDQSVRVDVRVIAATNANLEEMVARSLFRRDLYYRLKVVTIQVPPLRNRRSDIPLLVETFLDELSRSNAVPPKAVTPETLEALKNYAWPGNVRELKNVLESMLVSVVGDTIRPDDLPSSIQGASAHLDLPERAPGMTLADMERELIQKTLEFTGGNRTHSADLLGIGVRTLQRKIQIYRIHVPPTRRRPRQPRPQERPR